MRRILPTLLTTLAVVALPQIVAAEPPKRAGGDHDPAKFFQRLDADKDGTIVASEVPEKAPEFIKAMLKRMDSDGDKKVTRAEFDAAVKKHRAAIAAKKSHGKRDSHHGQHGHHGHPQAKPGPHHGMPNPAAMFAKMDTNKDKSLSLEEFTAGVKKAHHARKPNHAQKQGRPDGHHGSRDGDHRAHDHRGHGRPSCGPGAKHPSPMGFVAMIFTKRDANKDGKITLDEVPEDRREGFKKILEKADKDGDKAISKEEAKRIAMAIAAKMHKAGSCSKAGAKKSCCPKAGTDKCPASKGGKCPKAGTDKRRKEMQDRIKKWQAMSPEERKKAIEAKKKEWVKEHPEQAKKIEEMKKAWVEKHPEQAKKFEEMRKKWEAMSPEEKKKTIEEKKKAWEAKRKEWEAMSPEAKKKAIEAKKKEWAKAHPEQAKKIAEMRKKFEARKKEAGANKKAAESKEAQAKKRAEMRKKWEAMSPEERKKASEARRAAWAKANPERAKKAAEMRKKWEAMSPEEKKKAIEARRKAWQARKKAAEAKKKD